MHFITLCIAIEIKLLFLTSHHRKQIEALDGELIKQVYLKFFDFLKEE